METYLTASDVAVLLQLSVQTIRRYTMNKEIPFHKINRAVRFRKSEIDLWVEKRKGSQAKDNCEKTDGKLFNETENRVDV